MMSRGEPPAEIAIVGDLAEHEADITTKLLEVPPGEPCVLYFDSPGGNPYAGLALMSLLLLRNMQATGIVLGECSSAALWPLAACRRRIVTPASVLLFHPMKWESGENVGLAEAAEWARHFGQLEGDMDRLLISLWNAPVETISAWMHPGRYVSGRELVAAGLAKMAELAPLAELAPPATRARRK